MYLVRVIEFTRLIERELGDIPKSEPSILTFLHETLEQGVAEVAAEKSLAYWEQTHAVRNTQYFLKSK